MKKLYTLLVLLMSSLVGVSLMAMDVGDIGEAIPTGNGWFVTNKTGQSVTLGWYKSKIHRAYRSTWGPKEEVPAFKFELGDEQTRFIPFPPVQQSEGLFGHALRRELLVTHTPELLLPIVDADNSGILTDLVKKNSIAIFTKYELPPISDIVAGKVTLVQPVGTTAIKAVSEAFPIKEVYWAFENKFEEPVYCAWYLAPWDYQRKAFLNPKMFEKQRVMSIEPEASLAIPFPDKQGRSNQRQLLISFDPELLTNVVMHDAEGNLPHGVIARNQHDLKPYNSMWRIYNEDGVPYTSPLTNLITFINTTNEPRYAAMYYVKGVIAEKVGPRALVTEILPQLSAHIQYPVKHSGWRTQLLVATQEDRDILMQPRLSEADYRLLVKKDFSNTNLVNWYFEGAYAILTDILKEPPYNFKLSSIGGGALERIPRKFFDIKDFNPSDINALEARFREGDPLFMPNERIIQAAVDQTEEIKQKISNLAMETHYVLQRSEITRQAINEFLGEEVIARGEKVPKIALLFTGGGYRAMIETIGFLRGAEKTGVFDCATYMTGLSGSTWATNLLVASGLTPQAFSDGQRSKVGRGGLRALQEQLITNPSYAQRRFIESRFGQYHGPIGLYGHALANALLEGIEINGKTTHDITLSDLRTNLDPRRYPLPISVAVDPGTKGFGEDRVWYEFSPFYSGTKQEKGAWVDSMLFGSAFKRGTIQHFVPEYPLAQYMGIWGSAFALTPEDVAKNTTLGGYLYNAVSALGSGIGSLYNLVLWKETVPSVCSDRIAVGQMPNMSFKDSSRARRLRDNPFLCLIDAGITKETQYRHNFATMPALWRDVDVFIMCDSIGSPNTDVKSVHLVGAAQEAYGLGYTNFPQLHRSSIHEETLERIPEEVSTLIMEDKKPIVVYMKGKKHEEFAEHNTFIPGFDPDMKVAGFTSTTNFSYEPNQFDALTGLTEHIMRDEKTVTNIKQAIAEAVRRTKNN